MSSEAILSKERVETIIGWLSDPLNEECYRLVSDIVKSHEQLRAELAAEKAKYELHIAGLAGWKVRAEQAEKDLTAE